MSEHEGKHRPVVHPQRCGMGQHLSEDVDNLACSVPSERQTHAQSNEAQGGPMAPGVLGRNAGEDIQRLDQTYGP